MSDELKGRKIFPLNQTARADVLVRGNPVATRADASVENTFPGLEFDHRNLEKQFFPGLLFELHHGQGAWLRDFDRNRNFPFAEADLNEGMMLWTIVGRLPDPVDSSGASLGQIPVFGRGGSSVWQIIREIEPGDIGIVMGPARGAAQSLPVALEQQVQDAISAGQDQAIPLQGLPPIVILFGQRAEYLRDGVIDPELYEPGDLTRSLCSPWQYDFTDCGCWYWASNKPDMVAVTEDGPQIYNFQRVRTGDVAPEPPSHAPVVSRNVWGGGRTSDESGTPLPPEERVPREMNHAELIAGWEALPIVIDDRETDRLVMRPPETIPEDQLFPDLPTIIDRLTYLAGIEHALMIEYLYAYYSIDAPRTRPQPNQTNLLRLYEAANTILGVAIDEMRHFRWVNEILVMLGQTPVVRRAERTLDTDNNGRFLDHVFALTPATQAQIDWFIQVEQSSRDVDPDLGSDTIDGMYTRMLISIERSTEIGDDIKDRVLHLIKLIIDEGYDHFHRFQRVRELLPEPPDQSYLRLPADPSPLAETDAAKGLEQRVNRSYEVILNLLLVIFGRGDAEHGQLLEATRIAMVDSLDIETLNLIADGGAPLFAMPELTETRNLGRFSMQPEGGVLELESSAEAAAVIDPETIVLNATAPIDELNTADLASGDDGLRRTAERSSAAMARVRAAFIDVMRGGV